MIYDSVWGMVGSTPMVRLRNYEDRLGLKVKLYAKIESANPAGSAKDRVARSLLSALIEERSAKEGRGEILPKLTVIEPTSGNTGIAIAALGAAAGIRVIIVMPDTMSRERMQLIRAYGAELVLTEGALGMAGAVKEAERLRDSIPGSVIAGQFDNPQNPKAHFDTTGPEIFADLPDVDYFLAGVGTGGTLSGVGAYLKSVKEGVKVIGVEPAESPLITEGRSGLHGIQGIGANFIPDNFERSIADDIIPCPTEMAKDRARLLARTEGLAVGISSGAALFAAEQIAKAPEAEGKTVVVLLPDGGERYLSSGLFD